MRPAPPKTSGMGLLIRDPQPSGAGERTMPEKKSGFSYSIQNGFMMTDWPFGPDAPDSLSEALARSGYATKPSVVIGSGPVRIECFEKGRTVEWLVVVFTAGLEQVGTVSGFTSLMDLLEKWRGVVTAAAGTPSRDVAQSVVAAQPIPGVTTQPGVYAPGMAPQTAEAKFAVLGDSRRPLLVGVTIRHALQFSPRESAEIVPVDHLGRVAGPPCHRWGGNGWIQTPQAEPREAPGQS